jgi:putative small integral membrane protein
MSEQAASADPQILDIYKLAVEMADRVSSRRATANAFFLTVNTGLVAVAGLFPSNSGPWALRVTCLAGAVLAFCWFLLLRNYRKLNEAKFEVITAIEREYLPVHPFGDEWIALGNSGEPASRIKRQRVKYRQLGHIEKYVPLVYAALYVALGWLGA